MRSEYSYVLTETAESDLDRITEYLVRELKFLIMLQYS